MFMIIFVLVINMYLFIKISEYTCMPFIYVDVHLKTILVVSLFGIIL